MKFGKIFLAAVVAFAVVGQIAHAQEDSASGAVDEAVESEAVADAEDLIPATEVRS